MILRKLPAALRSIRTVAMALSLLAALAVAGYLQKSSLAVQSGSPGLVISQVYGGGGNSGATLRNDFVELFNRGTTTVNVTGWSVQYASAAGTTWQTTPLTGSVPPGGYYLVQQAAGMGGTQDLPTPDATGTIAMAAGAGKVALVNSAAALTGACPSGGGVVDLVGYGAANCFEGSGPTAATSNTTAALRNAAGCADTDNNPGDFSIGAPNPRNAAAPPAPCGATTNPAGSGAATPNAVFLGGSTLLTVTVTPGSNPTSTGLVVTGDLSSIGGSGTQSFFNDGTNDDATAGDNVFSFRATVPPGTAIGPKVLPITIGDAQARTGSTTIALTIQELLVVISQVYGGGGNSGATLRNDFVEIFNRGTTPVSLAGWSVQYTSSSGTSWQTTALSGTLAPGQYYLVQEAAGSGGTQDLPTPDATGTIAMAAGAGKVALVNSTVPLTGSGCPFGASVIDFVGYGNGTSCSEGSAAPAPSNTTAIFRARGGCRDTNNNGPDFSTAAPVPRNSSSTTRDCSVPPPFSAIHVIQGSGPASTLLGQEVTTSGIVTGRKSNGVFLQTPDAEADSELNTSQGIFVFTGGLPPVAAGDAVSVVGTVTEFFGLTQLSSSNLDVTVTSGGNTLPAAITLTPSILNPAGPRDQLERFEGMRLAASSLMTVAPSDEFGEVFAVLSGVPRPFREPGIEISRALPPGSPANVPRFDQNPERIAVDTDGLIGSTRLTLTSLVTLSNVVGPLEFSFGNYKILPETTPAATANLTATPVPAAAANEFTVASFNLENFYNTDSNFAERLTKASLVIRNVLRSPDILGVEEVGDLATLTDLANRLNSDSGTPGPAYQPFLFESDDDTERDIDVGVLVKTSRVNVVSVTQEGKNATYLNPDNGQPEPLNDRTPLILRARVQSPTGSSFPVTVIVNHLRSLIDVDQDPGDGPRVREKRRKQAEFLANLTQGLQGENLVLVGDFNAFQFNDGYVDVLGTVKGQPTPPDQVVLASEDLVNPNLTTLVDTLPAVQRYSFTFEGNPQTLDHVLVDDQMLARLSRFVYARNNADFPDDFQGDATRPERFSDHDMPVAYFSFPPPAADLSIAKADSPDPALTGATLTYTITVTNAGPDTATEVVVTDKLPARMTFVSCAATGGGVCGGSGNNRTATFASLAVGATETITLTATVDNFVFSGTTLSNTASVTSATTDPGLGNNSAAATTTVNRALRVTPVVECVTRSGDNDFTVRFGYDNPNLVAITIPVGLGNFFAPLPIDRGQPTTFLPGRQQNVFTAPGRYGILVWALDGRTAIGLINNPNQCPP